MYLDTPSFGRTDLRVLLEAQVGLGNLLVQGLPERASKLALVTILLTT